MWFDRPYRAVNTSSQPDEFYSPLLLENVNARYVWALVNGLEKGLV